MMSGLEDKVVVVTGSSSGIGAAIALEFAKYKCRLIVTGRNKERLHDICKQCLENGAKQVKTVIADLNEDEGIEEVVKVTLDSFKTIHVLVNNAGTVSPADCGGMKACKGSTESLDSAYKLLLRSPWKLCSLFIDELIKTKGCIINISSVVSKVAYPKRPAYAVMKAALDQLTRLLAAEFGMQGVRVNAVQPGSTLTQLVRDGNVTDEQASEGFYRLAKDTHLLEQKICMPEDQAKTVVFLASEDARMITGVCVPVDAGLMIAHPIYNFSNPQF